MPFAEVGAPGRVSVCNCNKVFKHGGGATCSECAPADHSIGYISSIELRIANGVVSDVHSVFDTAEDVWDHEYQTQLITREDYDMHKRSINTKAYVVPLEGSGDKRQRHDPPRGYPQGPAPAYVAPSVPSAPAAPAASTSRSGDTLVISGNAMDADADAGAEDAESPGGQADEANAPSAPAPVAGGMWGEEAPHGEVPHEAVAAAVAAAAAEAPRKPQIPRWLNTAMKKYLKNTLGENPAEWLEATPWYTKHGANLLETTVADPQNSEIVKTFKDWLDDNDRKPLAQTLDGKRDLVWLTNSKISLYIREFRESKQPASTAAAAEGPEVPAAPVDALSPSPVEQPPRRIPIWARKAQAHGGRDDMSDDTYNGIKDWIDGMGDPNTPAGKAQRQIFLRSAGLYAHLAILPTEPSSYAAQADSTKADIEKKKKMFIKKAKAEMPEEPIHTKYTTWAVGNAPGTKRKTVPDDPKAEASAAARTAAAAARNAAATAAATATAGHFTSGFGGVGGFGGFGGFNRPPPPPPLEEDAPPASGSATPPANAPDDSKAWTLETLENEWTETFGPDAPPPWKEVRDDAEVAAERKAHADAVAYNENNRFNRFQQKKVEPMTSFKQVKGALHPDRLTHGFWIRYVARYRIDQAKLRNYLNKYNTWYNQKMSVKEPFPINAGVRLGAHVIYGADLSSCAVGAPKRGRNNANKDPDEDEDPMKLPTVRMQTSADGLMLPNFGKPADLNDNSTSFRNLRNFLFIAIKRIIEERQALIADLGMEVLKRVIAALRAAFVPNMPVTVLTLYILFANLRMLLIKDIPNDTKTVTMDGDEKTFSIPEEMAQLGAASGMEGTVRNIEDIRRALTHLMAIFDIQEAVDYYADSTKRQNRRREKFVRRAKKSAAAPAAAGGATTMDADEEIWYPNVLPAEDALRAACEAQTPDTTQRANNATIIRIMVKKRIEVDLPDVPNDWEMLGSYPDGTKELIKGHMATVECYSAEHSGFLVRLEEPFLNRTLFVFDWTKAGREAATEEMNALRDVENEGGYGANNRVGDLWRVFATSAMKSPHFAFAGVDAPATEGVAAAESRPYFIHDLPPFVRDMYAAARDDDVVYLRDSKVEDDYDTESAEHDLAPIFSHKAGHMEHLYRTMYLPHLLGDDVYDVVIGDLETGVGLMEETCKRFKDKLVWNCDALRSILGVPTMEDVPGNTKTTIIKALQDNLHLIYDERLRDDALRKFIVNECTNTGVTYGKYFESKVKRWMRENSNLIDGCEVLVELKALTEKLRLHEAEEAKQALIPRLTTASKFQPVNSFAPASLRTRIEIKELERHLAEFQLEYQKQQLKKEVSVFKEFFEIIRKETNTTVDNGDGDEDEDEDEDEDDEDEDAIRPRSKQSPAPREPPAATAANQRDRAEYKALRAMRGERSLTKREESRVRTLTMRLKIGLFRETTDEEAERKFESDHKEATRIRKFNVAVDTDAFHKNAKRTTEDMMRLLEPGMKEPMLLLQAAQQQQKLLRSNGEKTPTAADPTAAADDDDDDAMAGPVLPILWKDLMAAVPSNETSLEFYSRSTLLADDRAFSRALEAVYDNRDSYGVLVPEDALADELYDAHMGTLRATWQVPRHGLQSANSRLEVINILFEDNSSRKTMMNDRTQLALIIHNALGAKDEASTYKDMSKEAADDAATLQGFLVGLSKQWRIIGVNNDYLNHFLDLVSLSQHVFNDFHGTKQTDESWLDSVVRVWTPGSWAKIDISEFSFESLFGHAIACEKNPHTAHMEVKTNAVCGLLEDELMQCLPASCLQDYITWLKSEYMNENITWVKPSYMDDALRIANGNRPLCAVYTEWENERARLINNKKDDDKRTPGYDAEAGAEAGELAVVAQPVAPAAAPPIPPAAFMEGLDDE